MNRQQKLRLYLDTTIPNYVFNPESPERMEITRRFMKLRFSPLYEMVISEIVLQELAAAPESKRVLLEQQVAGLPVLRLTPEADGLAEKYIQHRILPPASIDDARHVAIAVLNKADAVVSWNFAHLVNIRRSKAINELNDRLGLSQIEIITPEEVLE